MWEEEKMKTMFPLRKPWVAWVMLLVAVNAVISLFYLTTVEAQVILGAAIIGFIIQIAIFSAKGFVRLLGIGHILWIPMVFWLRSRIGLAASAT